MKKILSYLLRAVILLAVIFILVWIFFFAYLYFNRNAIIAKVKAQLNRQLKGTISIGDLNADFLHAFPYPAIRISNVVVHDSSIQQGHDFINAPVIYVRLQPLSLFDQRPSAGKITIRNATIYFYTDSTGRSNIVKEDASNSNQKKSTPTLEFDNTRMILKDEAKHKLHDIYFEELKCHFNQDGNTTRMRIKLKGVVHGLSFNTFKGDYLHEKNIEGKFDLDLTNKKSLEFKDAELKIARHPFHFSGSFLFAQQQFALSVDTKKISYENILSILPKNIAEKISPYQIDLPVSIRLHLSGSLMPGSIPLTTINLETRKARITTPVAVFNDCAFKAYFTNQVDAASAPSDQNSVMIFRNFSGSWEHIALRSDSAAIQNLLHPALNCDARSIFQLQRLNELTGSNTMQFLGGEGEMNIRYKGSLINDSTSPDIVGTILLKNSELSYLPRDFSLKNCNATVEFQHQDVSIRKLSARAGGTVLSMNGSVANLLTLLNTPEMLTIRWNIFSPDLDVNNFLSYIGKRSSKSLPNTTKKKFFRIADKLDRMLQDGTADLHVQANHVRYKKFEAKDVVASIVLLQNKILLNDVHLHHAGGTIYMKGSLSDESGYNALNFTASLDHVNIPQVFAAFNNFGQDAVTEKNMKGVLSANVIASAAITDRATITQNSLAAKIDFSVENGELINFEPVEKISETAFKKRDFSHLRFAELKNNINVKGSAITIPNMEIHSNVLSMFVQGVYDTKNGTDMSIRVPVSNLKKPEPDVVLKNKNKPGLSIRLRAKTGDDGKLKVTWDPFNKSGKANSISKATPRQQ